MVVLDFECITLLTSSEGQKGKRQSRIPLYIFTLDTHLNQGPLFLDAFYMLLNYFFLFLQSQMQKKKMQEFTGGPFSVY